MSSNPKKRGTVNISLLGTKLAFQLAFLDLLDEKKLKEDSGFPYEWNKGDTCVMITNKTKKIPANIR